MLAQRTSLLTSSRAFDKNATVPDAAIAKDIIDLTGGEILSDLAPTVRDGAVDAIDRQISRSSDPVGLFELRRALARALSAETAQPWSADELVITNGARQALFNVAMVILNPGDEVLIPAPCGDTFPANVALAGGTPVFVDTRHHNYIPRIADLAAAVTPKTKMILINTPNNPTGVIYGRETLADVAQFAADLNIWILFDESYRAFAHAPHTHCSIIAAAPQARERVLIVNSFSNSLALSGWRVGYLAGPSSVISVIGALQGHTTGGGNIIAQHALVRYLERGDIYYQALLQRHVANARALGLSILSSLKFVPAPPAQGGFHFYLDLTELQKRAKADGHELSADIIVNALLTNAGVATVSGTVFGDPSAVRVSYAIELGLLQRGLRRLTATLNGLPRRAEQA